MKNNNTIGLNTNLKIQNSLFNFFAPTAIAALFVLASGMLNFLGSLIGFLGLVTGLGLLFYCLKGYTRRVIIHDNNLVVAEGDNKKPKIIARFPLINLDVKNIQYARGGVLISVKNKQIKLLNTYPSIIALVLWVPVVYLILVGILNNYTETYRDEIVAFVNDSSRPDVNEQGAKFISLMNDKKPSDEKAKKMLYNVIYWAILILIILIGILGIFMMPFYPFMGK